MISHTFHEKKQTLLPAPHMLLLRQNSFMSHSADFVLGFCGPSFTFFANLEPNLQPQLHMKPFVTNPPPTQKTVEDDSYKLRTQLRRKKHQLTSRNFGDSLGFPA